MITEEMEQSGKDVLAIALDLIESGEASAVIIKVDMLHKFPDGRLSGLWLVDRRDRLTLSTGEKVGSQRVSFAGLVPSMVHNRLVEQWKAAGVKNPVVPILEWNL